jgi:uncharacterized protein (DUF2225 family)
MTQLAPVYNSKVECPVCKNTFEVGKVRSKFVRSRGQDTDLRPLYEGENPLFYEIGRASCRERVFRAV